MKKLLLTTLTILMATMCLWAADAPDREGKPKERKRPPFAELVQKQANYIADQMNLEGDKRALFITTFTNCQKEIWDLGPDPDRRCQADKDRPTTNEQAAQNSENRFRRCRQILEIREKYYTEYSKFLTPLQIEEVYRLEKKTFEHMSKGKKPGHRPKDGAPKKPRP